MNRKHSSTKGDRISEIESHIHSLMKLLGLNLNDPHFRDTPSRVARMYLDMFAAAITDTPPDLTTFAAESPSEDVVSMHDIPLYSTCAHHLVPFFGHAHIAYVPHERIIGLSKLPRLVAYLGKRPQLQEQLTASVADELMLLLEPKSVLVAVQARHLCVEMRGIKTPGVLTTTYSSRGEDLDDYFRTAFMNTIASRRAV